MTDRPHFLMITCQVDAEDAVRGELVRGFPAAHPAYSRPGFVTFKLPEQHFLPADFELHSVFARAAAFSLGRVSGPDPETMAASVWQMAGDRPFRRIHAWQRDPVSPGDGDFDPAITPAAAQAAEIIRRHCPRPATLVQDAANQRAAALPGETILDCVLVQPDEWWVGFHEANLGPSRWPGGMVPLELPAHAVSRAWLKMEEALRWSELPIEPGARCAELGSAPGGATQSLLSRGMIVMGIDPAEMHPDVLAHPNFTHVRKRVTQVRRREFRKIRWLTADMNVAPRYTLDAVEAVVTHPENNIRGMILTLKLFEWKLADELPEYLQRIGGWGYNLVRARQLPHNRREVCVAALQKPFVRKPFYRTS